MAIRKSCYCSYIFIICAIIFDCVLGNTEYNDFLESGHMYCFQCNSGIDLDCATIIDNDATNYHYKPCLDNEKYNGSLPFCRKIVQKVFSRNNLERVIRKCGWVRHPRLDCYNTRNEDHIETICQCFTKGCNGAPSLQYSSAVLLFVTAWNMAATHRFYLGLVL